MTHRRDRLKTLTIVLWGVALITGVYAMVLVPRQVAELGEYGYGYHGPELDPEGDLWLRGDVLEAWTGAPVGDVVLRITRMVADEPRGEDGFRWEPSAPLQIRSDPQGHFEIQVARGLYRVDLDSTEYIASPWNRVIVDELAQMPAELRIVAHSLCDLTITVADNGRPIEGAELALRGGDPGRAFYIRRPSCLGVTNRKGQAHWHAMCGPNLVHYIHLPGEDKRFVERPVEVGPEPTEIRFEAGEVRRASLVATDPATVVDERLPGRPSGRAKNARDAAAETVWGSVDALLVSSTGDGTAALVRLEAAGDLAVAAGPNPRRVAALNQERARFDGVAAGTYRLWITPLVGPVRPGDVFTVAAGEHVERTERVPGVQDGTSVNGRVHGPDGPVVGAEVYLLGIEEVGRLFLSFSHAAWIPKTITGADGMFTLKNLPAGKVVLVAYHRGVGASSPLPVTLDSGGPEHATLRLEPGTADRRSGWVGGALLALQNSGPCFWDVVAGSRADEIGIVAEDCLMAIDGVDVRWRELQWLYMTLSGEWGGTPARITIRDGFAAERELPWGSVPDAAQDEVDARLLQP